MRVGGSGQAEAARIGAEFGLGRHVKAWRRGPKVVEWGLAWGFLIGLPASTILFFVTANKPPGAAVEQPVSTDEDGKATVYDHVLRDRAGNPIKVGKLPRLADRAQQLLASRLIPPAH